MLEILTRRVMGFPKIRHLILALALAAPCMVHAQQVIRVVADPWPPFGGADLPARGISLDVITTVLTRAGYSVETAIVPWQRALDGVKGGTYDVIGSVFYSTELAEDVVFSDPFYQTEVRFMRQRGTAPTFTDIASLQPYTIAVGAGYLYEEGFDSAAYLRKTEVTEVIQGVRMVAAGRIDLTLDSVDVLEYIIHTQEPELSTLVEILPQPLSVQEIHMAVRPGLPGASALLADFNRVLHQMREEGALDELLAKHRSR